ncbi:hypothetical protein OAJ15_03250 [Pseudomonadota bacterium]|nr:hypothetical protein [Pseudomonadota bacterium]
MISKNNFDLARSSLGNQAKYRGIKDLISRDNWDTFAGWKKRGRSIKSGSKGFKVQIVIPHSLSKKGAFLSPEFATVQKTLFSKSQTRLNKPL